ncbi:unnamed protein product [Ectocarpus sp. 12 AP-2014]
MHKHRCQRTLPCVLTSRRKERRLRLHFIYEPGGWTCCSGRIAVLACMYAYFPHVLPRGAHVQPDKSLPNYSQAQTNQAVPSLSLGLCKAWGVGKPCRRGIPFLKQLLWYVLSLGRLEPGTTVSFLTRLYRLKVAVEAMCPYSLQ